MKPKEKKRSLSRRVVFWGLGFVAVLLVVGVVVLRVAFNGAPLGEFVENQLNQNILGTVEIDEIEWPLSALPTAVTGGWIPVEIHGFRLYDDNKRKVIDVPLIRGKIDAHAAMFGNHDLVFDDVVVPEGGTVLVRMAKEPYPIHDFDFEVVSLLSAFYSKQETSIYTGLSAAPRANIDFRHFDMRGITLMFEFESKGDPVASGKIENLDAEGFLYADDSDPLSRKLYYSVTATAPTGVLETFDRVVPLRNIEITKLEQLPTKWPRDPYATDVTWRLTASSTDNARVTLDGGMFGYWQNYFGGDYRMAVALRAAGGLASALSDGLISGDEFWADIFLDGPVLGPRVQAQLGDVTVSSTIAEGRPPLTLSLAKASGSFDSATMSGQLDQTVAHGEGGEIQLQATFALEPIMQFDANISIPHAIEVGVWLPPQARDLAGTKLRGRLHVFGTRDIQRLDNLHLRLGSLHLRGEMFMEKDTAIHATRVWLTLGESRVSISNSVVDIDKQTLHLNIDYASKDARRYLRYFGAPELATGVTGSARIRGTYLDPIVTAKVSADGVPYVDRVDTDIGYQRLVLSVNNASVRHLGGEVTAHSKISLGPTLRILNFEADAHGVDLASIPLLGGNVKGRASGRIDAHGSLKRLVASGDIVIGDLNIAGDDYRDGKVHLDADGDNQSFTASFERDAGGSLLANITRTRAGEMGGAITLRDIPIETFRALAAKPGDSSLGGLINADFSVNGTDDAITADGTVSMVRAWFGRAFLGAADLEIERDGDGFIAFHGHMFQGKLIVDGRIQTRAPYAASLTLQARRVELDQFVPELVDEHDIRGWFSGSIAIETQLQQQKGFKPSYRIDLTELSLLREALDPQGRPAPIRVRNRAPLSISYDGKRAKLAAPAVFRAPGGDFTVSGGGTADELDIKIDGKLAVTMLQPYLAEYFDKLAGTLTVDAQITGSLKELSYTGTVQFNDVVVRLQSQEAEVGVPYGKITITESQIAVTDFTVRTNDPDTKERAELKVRGGIGLAKGVPTVWALQIEGQLAGTMLLAAAPQIFSTASGVAYVSIWLRGPGKTPDDIDGTLWFGCPTSSTRDRKDFALLGDRCKIDRPIALGLRGAGRQIRMDSGHARIGAHPAIPGAQLLEFVDVGGWLDDEGRLEDISGEITIEDSRPTEFDIRGAARAIPLRIPRELELTVSANGLRVWGDLGSEDGDGAGELNIDGKVEIVDGRYIRPFNVLRGFFSAERTSESSPPIYESVPLLANANLNIDLESRAFFVKSSGLNIRLSGGVNISGTPVEPRFSGNISVDEGKFKIQGMRARFTRTSGNVAFTKRKSFPGETPEINVLSQADFRDANGQEHIITLAIRGTLENYNFDLYTDTGLNKGQTLTLISSGRTADALRKSLGDQGIGRDTSRIESNDSTSGSVTDELVKGLAGDALAMLIGDQLRKITGLDVARVEISTTSVSFHGELKLFQNFLLLGDLRKNLRGWQWNARGELRVSDSIFLDGEWLQRNQTDDAEQDISEGRLRAVWRKGWQ